MNWSSWTDFVHMGGHAPYVWGAVGVSLLALFWEWAHVYWRQRAALQALGDEA